MKRGVERLFIGVGVFLALILTFTCVHTAIAQDQGSARGNLSGIVADTSGAVVPGASVTMTGPIGSATQMTDEQGGFLFSTLVPGAYVVRVQKQGFKVAAVDNIQVLINKTTSIRVTIEPGEVTQTVEVFAPALTVDSTSAAVNSDLDDTFYKNIPVARSVTSLFYLSPGVTSGLGTGQANPSISGATGLENLYVSDGVAVNDPAFGGLGVFARVYGSLGTGINLSFVKEVQVKTAGFEPQYGHSTGGIVQVVTKSGGTETHGTIGGYFQAPRMTALFKNDDDFNPLNLVGRELHQGGYEGDFELGGYVPGKSLKNHLFYFGTFNPTWNTERVAPALGSGLFTLSNGSVDRKTTIYDYAAKLTWKLNDRNTVESTVTGDPAHTNVAPFNTLSIDNTSANSKWEFGSRNWAVRYNGTFGADWLVNGAFTWNWNHFNEIPGSPDVYRIRDLTQTAGNPGQRGAFVAAGLGFYELYDSNSKGIEFDTQKGYGFGGRHTFSVGYNYSRPSYDDSRIRSGPRFAIPATNAAGTSSKVPAIAVGQMDNATLQLVLQSSNPGYKNCTLCPYMNVPGFSTPQRVLLRQDRGEFSAGSTRSTGRNHAAFVNDSWAMGRHATLNLGLRWEEERLTGNTFTSILNDQWSPRISFIVDPKGDRKSKIYASFSRYAYILPLDISVRSLSSEQDLRNLRFAPASTTPSSCPAGTVLPCPFVTINSLGTVTPVLDAAHLLNKAAGGVTNSASFSSQATPLLPGTKMEYNDEFVVGAEHEFRGGIVASVRYIDRRLKRIIEDFGVVPIEGDQAGLGQFYGIGNITAATDFGVNANEIVFSKGAASTTIPAACFDKNNNQAPTALDLTDTFGNILGSACFPSVNLNPWTDSSGNVLPAALFGGEIGADGKPDGFNDPKREYQAVEFEVNKPLSQNWQMLANYRVARLQGNYEGAFRNDNNQSDPGISSLFDFTPGLLGLLGFQQSNGILNSDRKHVVNVYTTYILDRSKMKGLVLGAGVRVQSGVPLTTLAAQVSYLNKGEVPSFGRGDLGRAPVTGTVDAHVEYPWKLTERTSLRFGIDLLNIANTKRNLLTNEFVDLTFGVPNADFKKPGNGTDNGYPRTLVGGFVAPFSARAMVRLVF
jgi:hypothetical protein